MRSPYLLDNTGNFWVIRVPCYYEPWYWYGVSDYRSRYNQSDSHWHTLLLRSSTLFKIAPGLYTDQYRAVEQLLLERQRIKDIKRLLHAWHKNDDFCLFGQILALFDVDDPEALLLACKAPERGDLEQLTWIARMLHLEDCEELVQVASILDRDCTNQDSHSIDTVGFYNGGSILLDLDVDCKVQTNTNGLYRQIISILNLYSFKLFIKSADILNIKHHGESLLEAARILEIDSCNIYPQIELTNQISEVASFLKIELTNQISEVASFLNIDSSCLLALVRASVTSPSLFNIWRESAHSWILCYDYIFVNNVTDEIPSWKDDDCLLLLYTANNLSIRDPDLLKRLACILGIVDVGRYLHVAQRLGIPFQALRVHTIQQQGDGSAFYNKYKLLLASYAKGLGLIPTDAEAAINLILYRLVNTSGTGSISGDPVRSLQGLDSKSTLRRLKRQLVRLTRARRRVHILIVCIRIKARQKAHTPTLKNKHIAYKARSNISCCHKIHQNKALTNRTTTSEEHSLLAIVMLPGYSTYAQFLLATDGVVALTRRSGT